MLNKIVEEIENLKTAVIQLQREVLELKERGVPGEHLPKTYRGSEGCPVPPEIGRGEAV
jgi:hypothetical protein